MGKYYCRLCETTHPDLRRHTQCPECAQFYCEECLEMIIEVGRNQCPYCDTSLTKFQIDLPVLTDEARSESNLREQIKHHMFPKAHLYKDESIWTEDQADLLRYSLDNIFKSVNQSYLSKQYYLSTPFSSGYRFLEIQENSLTEIIVKATEFLKTSSFESLNIETEEGIAIMTVSLEAGSTVVLKDVVTESAISTISL